MKELTKTAMVFSAIKEKIIKGELVKGDTLSPVLTLAGEFGVSTFTIIKAFERLEKENLIIRVNKSGVYVGAKTKTIPVSCKKAPSKTRAQEIAESIILEIIQGRVRAGELLSLNKVLAYKYHTSKITITKVIEILIDNKYIHKDGFRYKIGQPTVSILRPAKNRVYVLTEPIPGEWKFLDPHHIAFFLPFEHELQKHGIISFENLNFWNESDLIHKASESGTAGFLIDFLHLNLESPRDKNFQNRFYEIAEVISKKHLPLVVDNYNSILYTVPNFTFKPVSNLFFIGRDDYKSGEKAGTFLASMGHKQIAYFCFGNYPGNFQHLRGVECAMKRFFNNESYIHFFHENSEKSNWHANFSTYRSLSGEEKKRCLEGYTGLFKGYQFEHNDPIERIYPHLANRIKEDIAKKAMIPLFEKALQIREITAWVGTGYRDTSAAVEFLTERGVNIPDKISLFGFADGPLTSEYGITAYNFMEEKAAYLAAHCILGDIPIKKNRNGYVEYEGQIMVRKSVKAI
jgi:DNA-binding transcriptional regulator YhcF (GntR family)/DNA-binding LacI/PurR family transcriptional regulator